MTENNAPTMGDENTPATIERRAADIAETVDALAVLLDSRAVTAGTVRHVGKLTDDDERNGYGMTSDDAAAAISRARAAHAHPDAGSTLLDILAKDAENRVTGAAVRQYRAAWVFVWENVGAPADGPDGDTLLLAAYRVTSKTGRNMGDRLAAIRKSLAATPAGQRAARALTLFDNARTWWNRGGVTDAENVSKTVPSKQTSTTPAGDPDESADETADDDETPTTSAPVPPSADVVTASIAAIAADVAGFSGPALARVLNALDELIVTLDEHPAAADAREFNRKHAATPAA